MEEQQKKLQEYEKQLLEQKQQLSRLTEEMAYMEQQLRILKLEAGLVTEKVTEPPKPASIPEQAVGLVKQSVAAVLPEAATQKMREAEQKARMFRKKDLEKTVGRSLMGVFASVLIFISLILFATLLLPYFNDTAKMITTYVLSFAFTGVGLWKLQKDRENKFYIALTGCGIGAVYISLLLSNFYFKAIGDIALYVLIGVWAVAVCFLAKLRNQIFQVIGQLGITIAMIFGCALCIDAEDSAKFIALAVFYLISSGVFYIVHREPEFAKNRVHYIFNAVNCIALYMGCSELMGEEFYPVTVLILLVLAVYIALMLLQRTEKAGLSFGIIFSAHIVLEYFALELLLGDGVWFAVAGYLLAVGLLGALEWKRTENFSGWQLAQGVLIWAATVCLNQHEALYLHGLVLLVILPLLLIGFIRKNKVFRYGSIIVAAFLYVFTGDGSEVERLLMGGVVLAAALYLQYRCKEQYSRGFKYAVHGFALLFFWQNVSAIIRMLEGNWKMETAVTYAVCALYNMAMIKSCFGRNLNTGEKEKNVFYNLVNLLAMITGTILISLHLEEIPHLLIILTTLAAFLMNAKNLLDKRDNIIAGIYVGVKFTVLLITILGSFDTVNYIVSISCFVLAIVSIFIGFRAEYRSLRLFGLALSLISTFKLIMVDINYDNTLGNALSFFASGLLCFAISMMYNYIAKKREEKEED